MVILGLILFRLYLPILVKNYVNKELNRDPEYKGSVEDVGIHLLRGSYSLFELKIERVEGQKTYPLIAAREIEIGLSWRELFNGAIVAIVDMHEPQINIVLEGEKQVKIGGRTMSEKKSEEKTWQQTVNNLIPLKIGTLTAERGEFHFHDLTSQPRFELSVDRLHIEAHNLTNSTRLSQSLFADIVASGRAMKSGEIKTKIYLNPLSTPPDLKLDLVLKGLNLVELNKFFSAYGKFDVKKGSFDLYGEIATNKNKVGGYFKPLITDLQVSDFEKDRDKGLGHAVWEKIVAAAGGILKNFPKDRQAAKIPFEGNLDSPDFKIWPMITSIFHNMFLGPLEPKLDGGVKLNELNQKK